MYEGLNQRPESALALGPVMMIGFLTLLGYTELIGLMTVIAESLQKNQKVIKNFKETSYY